MHALALFFLVWATSLVRAGEGANLLAEIPIEFRDGLLWVEVQSPGSSRPLRFLLDSGASSSVLNVDTARRLGLKLGRKVQVAAVATSVTGHWPVRMTARAGSVPLPGEYLALDLGKLSAGCGRLVDGLIGADFFRGRVVQIDYDAQKLRLLSEGDADRSAYLAPLEDRSFGFRVGVRVNEGVLQSMRLDTGCATALHWVSPRVGVQQAATQSAVGFTEVAIPQIMTGVRLGNCRLDTVPTGVHRRGIFPGETGLVGNGVLALFGVVTFDTVAGRLLLGRHEPRHLAGLGRSTPIP